MKNLLRVVLVFTVLFAFMIPAVMAAHYPGGGNQKTTISADDAIVDVHAVGFVDTDGAKLSAIVVEYNVDLTGADVSADAYEITDYAIGLTPEIGSDPGVITGAAVYKAEERKKGKAQGKGHGNDTSLRNYVVIKVNTDYQLGRVASSYKMAMIAGVLQTGTITTRSNIITPGSVEIKNYEEVEEYNDHSGETEYNNYALDGKYTIKGTEEFRLFTKEEGTAFFATDCFEEATGEYVDVELPYALYVPKDYNPRKRYALVLHIHDAGFMGDDPMIALTESQGPVNFASKEVQQIARRQGLGGVIVVCPQVAEELRSTRDDYSLSAAVPATWQLMDYLTERFHIDMNRIYGEGQSMGGMQVAAMAAQRDNYFAAWWANGCQWGSNFSLDDPTYNGEGYYEAPADGTIIWTEDSDGNPVNYRNFYYLVSDDNILINNCMSDNFSTSVWKEFKYLYLDLAGAEIPYTYWNPLTASKAEQNAALNQLVAQPNDLGIYWAAFEGGNHMATWIYSHGVSAAYHWLLSQTRETEMQRDKLDLNKPFELAEVQLEEEDRAIAGGSAYLVTGKYGAGTLYYNSALYGRGGNSLIQPPAWWPLMAGAGGSEILFDEAMFADDLPDLEGFSGVVHDAPHARVLVLESNGVKVAICSLELVNIPAISIDRCKEVVSEKTDTPVDNVWVHATHAITTPHYPGDADHSPDASDTQAWYYYTAVEDAITEAAEQAAGSFQNVFAGVGTGYSYVNLNKDVLFPDGNWYMGFNIGLNDPLPSNKTMTVLRLDSLFGDPVGFFISHGTKPTAIDNAEKSEGTRQISSDVPGKACLLMEEEYGVPVLFAMPAAADQIPREWAYPQEWDEANWTKVQADYGVEYGLDIVERLGTEMGVDAIAIAEEISSTGTSRALAITEGSFLWPNKAGTSDVEVWVGAISFGDTAFVGFKPELNAVTELELWEASPFEHTLLLSFVNGDAHYMPDANACDLGTTEWQKSAFARGAAEQFVITATDLLESIK